MTPKLDMIGLVVQDMASSLAFYRCFGVEFPDGSELEGHVEVTLPGGLRLSWDTLEVIHSFDPSWSAPVGSSRVALSFLLETPAKVDAKFAELESAGCEVHKAPWDAFWGQRYAIFKDPDGNTVDLFASLV